jgi:uncharacterized protein (DUF952 family)
MAAATIYKLLTRAEWVAAQEEGVYRGSAHDRRDGFIHFSTAAQLAETARKYFSGVPDLLLLAVDAESLKKYSSSDEEGLPLVVWEPARGGDLFPHLYGSLPVSKVKSVIAIPLSPDGIPVLPNDLEP